MEAWRLVAHEGCGMCVDAMRRLADHLVGAPVTVQVLDAQSAPPDVAHAAPALLDPHDHVVWHGLFDEDATRAAFDREHRLHGEGAARHGRRTRSGPGAHPSDGPRAPA